VKKETLFSIIFLFIALMIYLIWRSENVLVNFLVSSTIGVEDFRDWRTAISARLLFPEWMIYSMPGGLWVFVSTMAFKDFFIDVKKATINLLFLPPIIALFLEITQLIHLTHGTFDGWDIILIFVFWVSSILICPASELKEDFRNSEQTSKKFWAIISVLILSLAHQI